MEHLKMKKWLKRATLLLVMAIMIYQAMEIRSLSKDYRMLNEGYVAKVDTSFRHALHDWNTSRELVAIINQIQASEDYLETRELIDSAREMAATWSKQLVNLIHLSDSVSLNEPSQIEFYRVNEFWFTSEQQYDMFFENRSIDWYIFRRMSYLYWQTKHIDNFMEQVLGDLARKLVLFDEKIAAIQEQDRYFWYESQRQPVMQQRYLHEIREIYQQINELGNDLNQYTGEVTIISKNEEENTLVVMYGVTVEELASTSLELLKSDQYRPHITIDGTNMKEFPELQVGQSIAVWNDGYSQRGMEPFKVRMPSELQ
ncbi:hypothetical protein [Anaerobacillus alkaliphilus]|nr:hypothetical protein [Anaerobacillus alkaliphilus]